MSCLTSREGTWSFHLQRDENVFCLNVIRLIKKMSILRGNKLSFRESDRGCISLPWMRGKHIFSPLLYAKVPLFSSFFFIKRKCIYCRWEKCVWALSVKKCPFNFVTGRCMTWLKLRRHCVRFFLPLVRGNDSIDSSVPEGAVSAYDSKSICSNQTTVSVFVWTAKTQQTTVNIHAWTVKTWVFTHEQ